LAAELLASSARPPQGVARTADRAVEGPGTDHRGPMASSTNSQLSAYDRLSGTHRAAAAGGPRAGHRPRAHDHDAGVLRARLPCSARQGWAESGGRGPKSASARPGPCTRPRSADALTRREGAVAFAMPAFDQQGCPHENPPPSRCSRSAIRLRGLPLPTRRHRAGGALVPALRAVLRRRRRVAHRTRHPGRPRQHLPLGAALHAPAG
jgi:hypothetical protein